MLNRPTYFKCLTDTDFPHGVNPFPTHGPWPREGWMPPLKHPKLHHSGYHVVEGTKIAAWLGDTLWAVDVPGAQDGPDAEGLVAVEQVRLHGQWKTWNAKTARLFACLCAMSVLNLRVEAGGQKPHPQLRGVNG